MLFRSHGDYVDIHGLEQRHADKCVAGVRRYLGKTRYKGGYSSNSVDALGCIVWLVNHGLRVRVPVLRSAIETAVQALQDREHLESYCDEGRGDALRAEIQAMKLAIQNGGVGRPQHVKGLLERMNDIVKEES